MNKKIKNMYIGILAVLICLLTIISPVSAANTANQAVNLLVHEYVGFSLSNNNITFNTDNLGITLTTPTYNLTNQGNTNIDLSIKAADDFNGPETILLTDGYYSLIYQNISTSITKNNNNIFKTGLNPQRHGISTINLYQKFTVPYGVYAGNYNTTVTYTAMKTL